MDDVIPSSAFFRVQFMEVFDRPLLEFVGDMDASKMLTALSFQFCSAHAFLKASRLFAFGTMIVGIVKECWIRHLLNRRLTARAGIAFPVREGVPE